MNHNFIGHQAPGSLDAVFEHSPLLSSWLINDYPIMSLIWNLALLAAPLLLSLALENYYQRTKKLKRWFHKVFAAVLGLIWLVFIPNTAYIITDVRHLHVPDCQMSAYYRVCHDEAWTMMIFFMYACVGWIFFVYLTRRMKLFLTKMVNRLCGRLFILGLVPMISLGVLLGLLDRWNSWQIVSSPWLIGQSAWSYFSEPVKFKNWLIFTGCLYVLYYVGEILLIDGVKLKKFKHWRLFGK